MLPFLEFSKKLAAKGIKVSFISTPQNLKRLPLIPLELANRIKMVEIPLPSVEGLQENCEATMDLQPEQAQHLKKAYDMLAEPIENILEKNLPDFIVVDFAAHWIPESAAKFGIPTVFFSVYTAATLVYLGPPGELTSGKRRTCAEQFTKPPDWITFPSLVAHRPDYAPIAFRNLHFPDKSGLSSGQRLAKLVKGCSSIAVKSCLEFEGEYINLLEELYRRPVIPIGVLPPTLVAKERQVETNSSWSTTFQWLDKQKPKSVLFVGFGSEYKMPREQIHELAFAIELSRLPFIWILRKPEGADSLDVLPLGFISRTSNMGIVSLGWAPQLEILSHPAIGGCLFHSGWGSIIECLGFGHPLILMPMVYDQGLNARLLVEKEVGHEVPRNADGSFSQDDVARSIRLVMVETEGASLRRKAAEMKNVFGNQERHDDYIHKFIQNLENLKVVSV